MIINKRIDFTDTQVIDAYARWYSILGEIKNTRNKFWKFIGANPYDAYGYRYRTKFSFEEPAAFKMNLLLSPHYKAILKVYEVRNNALKNSK